MLFFSTVTLCLAGLFPNRLDGVGIAFPFVSAGWSATKGPNFPIPDHKNNIKNAILVALAYAVEAIFPRWRCTIERTHKFGIGKNAFNFFSRIVALGVVGKEVAAVAVVELEFHSAGGLEC